MGEEKKKLKGIGSSKSGITASMRRQLNRADLQSASFPAASTPRGRGVMQRCRLQRPATLACPLHRCRWWAAFSDLPHPNTTFGFTWLWLAMSLNPNTTLGFTWLWLAMSLKATPSHKLGFSRGGQSIEESWLKAGPTAS